VYRRRSGACAAGVLLRMQLKKQGITIEKGGLKYADVNKPKTTCKGIP